MKIFSTAVPYLYCARSHYSNFSAGQSTDPLEDCACGCRDGIKITQGLFQLHPSIQILINFLRRTICSLSVEEYTRNVQRCVSNCSVSQQKWSNTFLERCLSCWCWKSLPQGEPRRLMKFTGVLLMCRWGKLSGNQLGNQAFFNSSSSPQNHNELGGNFVPLTLLL